MTLPLCCVTRARSANFAGIVEGGSRKLPTTPYIERDSRPVSNCETPGPGGCRPSWGWSLDVFVNVDYPESQQALRLCAALRNPLAWAYPIRLWTWAFKNEKRDGLIDKDAVLLAMACRYDGDADAFARIMLDVEVIDDEPAGWRIRGSHRWGRFWRERDRLQAINEARRAARDATRAARDQHADPSRSPRVEHADHENTGDFDHATRATRVQHAIATRGERVENGVTSSSSSSVVSTGVDMPAPRPRGDAAAAAFIGQAHLDHLRRKGLPASKLTVDESKAASELAIHLGLDFAPTLDHFHRDARSFYVERRWPLRALLRDLREHQPTKTPASARPRRPRDGSIPDDPMAQRAPLYDLNAPTKPHSAPGTAQSAPDMGRNVTTDGAPITQSSASGAERGH